MQINIYISLGRLGFHVINKLHLLDVKRGTVIHIPWTGLKSPFTPTALSESQLVPCSQLTGRFDYTFTFPGQRLSTGKEMSSGVSLSDHKLERRRP